LEALKLFREFGIPWNEWHGALVRAARCGRRATLEWLLANGCCPVRDDELSGMEAEVISETMAAAASVAAQAAAVPAAAAEGADAAPAVASGVAQRDRVAVLVVLGLLQLLLVLPRPQAAARARLTFWASLCWLLPSCGADGRLRLRGRDLVTYIRLHAFTRVTRAVHAVINSGGHNCAIDD
jgi:hypothetical protein